MIRPVRIGQMGAGDHHQIELLQLQCLLGQLRVAKAPGRGDRHSGCRAHAGSVRRQKTRFPGNSGVGGGETGAHAEQIEATILELCAEFDGFGQGLFVVAIKFDHPEACSERLVFRPTLAYRRERFAQEATAARCIAAIVILALIGVAREKALAKITMGKVQFQPFETSFACPCCCGSEVGLHAGDVGHSHCLRNPIELAAKGNR